MSASQDVHTHAGKRKFIKDLCNNVRDSILKNVERMPADWDGQELRELIADVFGGERGRLMTGKRKRDYRNEVLVNNLDR
jgi:hypothetical protein